ncbi:hypothetical protein F5Y04DRAFT_252747 [Hypomontagnella monticulosa]|nr:hypothetical protein F5Y04DRAFT_252747 [Hypomontagnella monticulosa]
MDPLAALGLASNILSFVDFSWKLVAGAHHIYGSASGASDNSLALETIATSITDLSNSIVVSASIPKDLRRLSDECHRVGKDLLGVINKLKVKGKRNKRWESFGVALKEVWNQGKMNELFGQLQGLQSQLLVQIQFIMLNQQSSVTRELARIDDTNRRLDIERTQALLSLKQAILTELEELKRYSQQTTENTTDRIRDPQHIKPEIMTETSNRLQNLSASLGQLERQGQATVLDQKFLRSLYFERFVLRHDNIKESYSSTFEWMLSDSHEEAGISGGFVEWLRSGHGTFWIQGKAGSGKSTLMKFLWHHALTADYLQYWAGSDHKLITASYFFWAAGDTLQKSQEGLLRTLLFEILRNCPEVIEQVRRSSAESIELEMLGAKDSWSLKSLTDMCVIATEQLQSARFCFFIDGLDEFKDDSYELARLIQRLTAHTHVKACISSRPWAEFHHTFGSDTSSYIKLEDHTAEDIRRYVHGQLDQNKQFKKLKRDDAAYESLANEVVKRAQGVFLWVFLVVRSLLDGAYKADEIDDMRRRVNEFPEDLEGFFKQMLDDVQPSYRRQTSMTFKIALTAVKPLPLMIHGFADDTLKNPQFALTAKTEPLSENKLMQRIEDIPNRLDARCKGLLEVVKRRREESLYAKFEVDFFHRTVRDFLRDSLDAHEMFQQNLEEDFSPSLTLCHAFLANLKSSWSIWGCPKPRRSRDDSISVQPRDLENPLALYTSIYNKYPTDRSMTHSIRHLLTYARQAEAELEDASRLEVVLDEVENVLLSPTSTWPERHEGKTAFLGEALQFGVRHYVERKLLDCPQKERTSLLSGRNEPLLHYALLPHEDELVDPILVKFLLGCGADPNQKFEHGTVWTSFLSSCAANETIGKQDSTHDAIGHLIQYSANLESNVIVKKKREVKNRHGQSSDPFSRSHSPPPDEFHVIRARDLIQNLYPETKDILFLQEPSGFSLRRLLYSYHTFVPGDLRRRFVTWLSLHVPGYKKKGL